MSTTGFTEGEVEYLVPSAGKTCRTWYKIFGDLKSGVRPLIALHGGPGFGHNYLLSLQDLTAKHGIPVLFYDQIGCGKSTHLPEKKGDGSFWTVDLFLSELDNLLQKLGIQESYDVYGNSWGGMLGAEHAIRQPRGLNRLVIGDSPASMADWVNAASGLRAQLPPEVEKILRKHERDGTTNSPEYEKAVMEFYVRHLCRIKPFPGDVIDSFKVNEADPTVYHTMNGPSEFHVVGTLKDWTIKKELPKIIVPTMLINGRFDEATDDCVAPYFDAIGKVKWATFAESSHMPHWEERDRFMGVLGRFLKC